MSLQREAGRSVALRIGLALASILHAGLGQAQTTPIALPIVGSDTSTIAAPSTLGKPNQSRIWYNGHQKRWDALVPRDDSVQNGGSASASDHYILKDVTGAQTFTAVELDDRNSGRADAFWDAAAPVLYVLGSHAKTTRFWRVDYDSATDAYAVDPGVDGVTVPGITHPSGASGGNWPASLYVSPNGRVWVAVLKDGALDVQQSLDAGASWLPAAYLLDASLGVGVTTWIHFEQLGTTFVGLFAAENAGGPSPASFHFFSIDQGADPTIASNWIDESSNIPAPVGTETADDHVAAARSVSEDVFFAVKTQGGGATDPLIAVLRRTPAGVWSRFTVTETQDVPEQTRPSLVVDDENDRLYVYTSDTGGGDGNRVVGSLSAPADLASSPMLTMFDGDQTAFDDLITPRHPVDTETGVAVLAHNNDDQRLWFGFEARPVPALPGLGPALLGALLVSAPLWQHRTRSRLGRRRSGQAPRGADASASAGP